MLEQRCLNCATERVGPYCHACGQKTIGPDVLSIRHLVGAFAHEVLTLDFKTVRSLRALALPGFLTREYLQGRQRAYLNPLKVYLLCAAIFFLAAPIAGLTFEHLLLQDDGGILRRLVNARMKARAMDQALFAERFDLRLQTVYTLGLSVSIAATTLLLALLFRRQSRPLGAHAVFALHYVAFLYLVAIAIGTLSRALGLPPAGTLALAYAAIGPYLFIALRRVYEEASGRTLAKVFALAVVTLVVDTTVNVAALLLTVWLV